MNLLITTSQLIGSNKVGEADEIAKMSDYQEYFKYDIESLPILVKTWPRQPAPQSSTTKSPFLGKEKSRIF